jgi:SAM-dependent methyltransferase
MCKSSESTPSGARRPSPNLELSTDVNSNREPEPTLNLEAKVTLVPNTKSAVAGPTLFGIVHDTLVVNRRAEVLTNWFAKFIPAGSRILDVGCGDGLISGLLRRKRLDISVQGTDVLRRANALIPVELFDGATLPFPDSSFDIVLFSDVLHHTSDATVLLREARRVASQHVLIKDHCREGLAASVRLRFMDWVGNARFGVALPYTYWTRQQWQAAWQRIGLQPQHLVTKLGLYPAPADWIFGARLHFIALLRPTCDRSS